MTDSDAVLAANLEFYRAFTTRDLAAMDALWARAAPVACIHRAGPRCRTATRSWRAGATSRQSRSIACRLL